MSKVGDADILVKVVFPTCMFVLGFITSRFTMTKKERKDYKAKLQDNSNSMLKSLDEQFQKFTLALREYTSIEGAPTSLEFYKVATTGEGYFTQMKMICDSILSGNVDSQSVMNTHRQNVKEVVDKSLPAFYQTMQEIAEATGIDYQGELKRENYESIYVVYEKYCC